MKAIIGFLYKYVILLLCLIVLILYLIYSSEILKSTETETIVINFSLALLNLFATIYITSRIGLWGWQNDNLKSQKKIAKTSIRHIRGYLTQIVKIQRIIFSKIEENDNVDKRDLKELSNHLEIFYSGIQSSEIDFKELVNEELIEQNQAEIEVMKILSELSKTKNELKLMKENKAENHGKIVELTNKVKSLKLDLETEQSKFNFSSPFLDSPRNMLRYSDFTNLGSVKIGETSNLDIDPEEFGDFDKAL
jgi:hypothetical protein